MHPSARFHLSDQAEMAALVQGIGFGILFAQTESGPRAVHLPVLLDGGILSFHVSRGNAIHDALAAGCNALFVASGPHAYLSPDDYGLEGRVPTWNYVAVELEGRVRPVGEESLIRLLDAMSARHEARLAPKPPWTRDSLPDGRFDTLTRAIAGFEMEVIAWRGTAKLDQDKPAEVRSRLVAALDARGETDLAQAMAQADPPLPLQGRGTAQSAVEGSL
jgi:transcriptional regulator